MLHKKEVIADLIIVATVFFLSSGALALLAALYLPGTNFATVATGAFGISVLFGAASAAVLLWILAREAFHSGTVTTHMVKLNSEENVLEIRPVGNSVVRSTIVGTPAAPVLIVPPGQDSPTIHRIPVRRMHLSQDPDTVQEVDAEQWQAFLNALARPVTKNGNGRGSNATN